MWAIDLLPHLPSPLRKVVVARSYGRWGGVSPPPFDSLNLGLFSGDRLENVKENLEIVKHDLGIDGLEIAALEQVHGNRVLVVDREVLLLAGRGDALVTGLRRTALLVQHADCQPVVLFDQERRVVACVHVGWKGLVADVLKETISTMKKRFLTPITAIWAGVGPSIGPCCYEFKGWEERLPNWIHAYINKGDTLDLKAATLHRLTSLGISEDRIFYDTPCTHCSPHLFSYRREGNTGRLGTVIALK